MTLALPWFLLFLFVATTQYFAASEWERQLWRRGETGLAPYFKIGVLWGVCGVGLFSLTAIMAADPGLVSWMAQNGLLFIYLAGAVAAAGKVAWSTVERSECSLTRGFDVMVVSLLLTLDYPILKYLQEGVWLVYPFHLFAFAMHMVSFSAVLTLSTLTLGYAANIKIGQRDFLRALIGQPRAIFMASCLALDALWIMLQVNLIRLYPEEFRSVSSWGGGGHFSSGESVETTLFITGLALVLLSQAVSAYSRKRLIWVQDKLAWNVRDDLLPGTELLALENTKLVKKALGLTKSAVVTWHAPDVGKRLGTTDLRSGTTFISPGLLHDAGLQKLGSEINLPDFWRAIIHPDDLSGAEDGIAKLIAGEISDFQGQWRFKAPNGAWLHIRGHIQVERSQMNGLPVALYGVYANVSEEVRENEVLGAAKVRQLNALRMIGHDLRGSLGTVLMSSTLLERAVKDHPAETITKNVDRIKSAANKALEFLTDAVMYARTEDRSSAGEPVTVPLHDLVQEVAAREISRFNVTSDKVIVDISKTCVLEGVLLFPLTSVLTNLISNGIKYTPHPTGRVRITARSLGAKTPGIAGCTLIEVEDEGVGIPSAFLERMFSAFSRAENVGNIEGHGLGLAIVANAIELLDAQINVISVPQVARGSVFTIILPNALVERSAANHQTATRLPVNGS